MRAQARNMTLLDLLVILAALVFDRPLASTLNGPHVIFTDSPPLMEYSIHTQSPGRVSPSIMAHPRCAPLTVP